MRIQVGRFGVPHQITGRLEVTSDALSDLVCDGVDGLLGWRLDRVEGRMFIEGPVNRKDMELPNTAPNAHAATGTQTITLTTQSDLITGTAAAEIITLRGVAAAGDSVDLMGGGDQLILDNGGNTLTISNVDTLTGGAGNDVITVTGAVSNLAGLISTLNNADTWINETSITASGETLSARLVNKNVLTVGTSLTLDGYAVSVDSQFKRIDGGAGIDRVELGESLDYRSFAGVRIDHVEILSLVDGDSDTIELDANAIKFIVDGENALTELGDSLVVVGDQGDVVRVHGEFLPSGSVSMEVVAADGSTAIYGTAGDDSLVYAGADLTIDAGDGIDTLQFSGTLDLSEVENLSGIERIDMSGGGSDVLQLNIADILNISTDNGLDAAGLTAKSGAQTGAVTLIQHFGSALNATLHFHMLYVDGVFDRRADFHPLKPPTPSDLDTITHKIAQRVSTYLEKAGYLERDVEATYLNPDAAHCKPTTKMPWQPSLVLPPKRRTAATG